MKILLTGGTGFLGSNLLKELVEDNYVYILSRKNNIPVKKIKDLVNCIKCDLTDSAQLNQLFPKNIDLVIHLASEVNIRLDGRYSENLIENNLNSTINLIEVMIDNGVKNLVFSSSMTVYGIKNEIPIKENGELDPIHFYGWTKKWAEDIIKHYSNRGLINSLILRLPGLYGGIRNTGYIYNLIRKMSKNQDVTINTNGLKFWETINIDDFVQIIKKLLAVWQWEKEFEIINCSYGEKTDFIDTAYKIKKILNSKSKITIEKPVDYKKFYLDNSKLKNIIEFDYAFEKSLEDFIKKYKYKSWLRK